MKYASVCSGVEAASLAWMPLGWEARKDYDLRESFYIDDDKLSPDRFEKCGKIIAKLKDLLENK